MAIVQLNWQMRHPYEANPDGYYYWTSVVYTVVDNPYDFFPYVGAIEACYFSSNLYQTRMNWLLITSPPHGGTLIESASSFNHEGYRDDLPTILENVGRVSLFVGEEYVGYKLLRGVFGTEEIENGLILPTPHANVQGTFADSLVAAGITTADGTPITSAVLDQRIHHWNLRHGTKRRARGVIHNP